MDAEDFVEIGAGPVHLGQVQVVNHDGERILPKIIPVQFNLVDSVAEFANLGFLGIIEEYVLGGASLRLTWLAKERLVLWKWRRLAGWSAVSFRSLPFSIP